MPASDGFDLLAEREQRLQVVAVDLDGDVGAHARDQLVEAHLDRLRELVVVAGDTRARASSSSRTSSSFGLRGSGHCSRSFRIT